MKRLLFALLFFTSGALAQGVPFITLPFNYWWDYPVVNVTATQGFTQVAHFELQIDGTVPVILSPMPIAVPSTVTGFLSFKTPADPALSIGPHNFNIFACPSLIASTVGGSGCIAAPSPFAFALNTKALPSASRLGVGL